MEYPCSHVHIAFSSITGTYNCMECGYVDWAPDDEEVPVQPVHALPEVSGKPDLHL